MKTCRWQTGLVILVAARPSEGGKNETAYQILAFSNSICLSRGFIDKQTTVAFNTGGPILPTHMAAVRLAE
jgi:hypothetical protein